MAVLMGQLSEEDSKKAWKKDDKKEKSTGSEGERWPLTMELPCRRCTDANNGEEVSKAISAFTTSRATTDIWNYVVSQGQDLCCFKCQHQLQWSVSAAVLLCHGCEILRERKHFDNSTVRRWEMLTDDEAYCLSCQGPALLHASPLAT